MTVWQQALPKPGSLNPLPEHPAIFGRSRFLVYGSANFTKYWLRPITLR